MFTKFSWKTERRRIKELIPNPNNPRQMTEKQIADLKASLSKFGLVEIPAINTDNTILAGHQRLKIMSLLGYGDEMIDVRVPVRKLTDEESKEYIVRSNLNTGEWDFDILANQFDVDKLTEWGFEPELLGISDIKESLPTEQQMLTCPKCGYNFTKSEMK